MVKVRNGTPGSLTSSSARILALNAPRPEYPYEARRQKITGDGVVIMSVDPGTGSVIAVSIWKSTGSTVLDNAAVAAFRRWRFKPGTVSRVKSPITFTMTGAQY
jgi:protein TonB